MNKYISIKESIKNNKTVYTISALALEQKDKNSVKKIPHPMGTTILEFDSLEEAKKAIEIAGFSAMLPSGAKVIEKEHTSYSTNYEEIIYSSLINLVNDPNPNIVANAISALSEIENHNCIEIFINKIGEDNESIRNNAMEAIIKQGKSALKDVLKALDDENWVRKNSAIICLQKMQENGVVTIDEIIHPLLKTLEDNNPIVKSSVISALGNIYKNFKTIQKQG